MSPRRSRYRGSAGSARESAAGEKHHCDGEDDQRRGQPGDVTDAGAPEKHAAQGGTRFVSHALISERDSVNSVYAALSRGREANLAHVDSEIEASQDSQPTVQDPVAVLARIVSRDEPGDALSALEARG